MSLIFFFFLMYRDNVYIVKTKLNEQKFFFFPIMDGHANRFKISMEDQYEKPLHSFSKIITKNNQQLLSTLTKQLLNKFSVWTHSSTSSMVQLPYIPRHFLMSFRFRINCIVSDGQDVTNFLLFSKTTEYFFNASAHHWVFNKKFSDPFIVPPQMIEKLNKTKIFQLRFGVYKSVLNKCEIYVYKIFHDIATEAYIDSTSPIKVANTIGPIATDAGSSIPVTPPTPNLADPLSVDQSQIQTPASQQHTS